MSMLHVLKNLGFLHVLIVIQTVFTMSAQVYADQTTNKIVTTQSAAEILQKSMRAELSGLHDVEEILRGAGVAMYLGYSEVAQEYLQKAADLGDIKAQINLAIRYYRGADGNYENENNILVYKGAGDPDFIQAAYWFQKAANQGDETAQHQLGLMYKDGEGVSKDYVKAVHWFRKAAMQKDASSQHMLGMMYYLGWGVEQNYGKATEWLRKAADQGYSMSINALKDLRLK